MTCIHHYSIMESDFTALRILCALPLIPLSLSYPWQPLIFCCLHSLAFSRMLLVRIAQYVDFSDLLLSLGHAITFEAEKKRYMI